MNNTKVFSICRVAYPIKIKNKAIEMKIEEYYTKEIMKKLNIRNRTQIINWWK